jgi:hypothetical protein
MLFDRVRMRAQDLLPSIAVARRHGLKALGLLGFYVGWLLITAFGTDFTPPGGWTLPAIGLAVILYSTLSITTFIAVSRAALDILRVRATRKAISHHVAPFWAVVTLSAVVGAIVQRYATEHWLSGTALGLGVAFALILGAYAAARVFQAARLEADRRQLATVDTIGPVTLF